MILSAREFDKYADGWRSILSDRPPNPLNDPTFVSTALEVFGTGNELLAILGDPDRPIAMGVVEQVKAGVWSTFQPAQLPLGPWVHNSRVSYAELMPSLIRGLPDFAIVLGITQKDPEIHLPPSPGGFIEPSDYLRTARIKIDRSWEEYWAGRDRNLRRQIERRLRRLREAGIETVLETVSDPMRIGSAVDLYGKIEARGWKGGVGTAVHPDNPQGVFYRRLLERFAERGEGRVYVLRFGGEPVAAELCVSSGDIVVLLKTTYDEQHAKFAPGILLRAAMFEDLFREGKFERIEFYGRHLEWQTRWTTEVRLLYHVNAYRWQILRAGAHARRRWLGSPLSEPVTA